MTGQAHAYETGPRIGGGVAAGLELVSSEQALNDLYENSETMAAQAQQNLANARDELRIAEYTWSVQQEGNRASESSI